MNNVDCIRQLEVVINSEEEKESDHQKLMTAFKRIQEKIDLAIEKKQRKRKSA